MATRNNLALSLCSLGFGAVTAADPVLNTQGPVIPQISFLAAPLDGSWVVLDELMTVGSTYAPVFTYSSASALQIDLTDLFVVSDQNEIYLDGVLAAATPAMPDWQTLFPPVGPMDDAPYTTDPDIAWTRPEFSKGSFVLPAGSHVLTFRNIHIPLDENGVPFADGTMAFRIVPEPSMAALFLLVGGLAVRRRRSGTFCSRGANVRRAPRCASTRYGALASVAVGALLTSGSQAGTPCGPLQADVSAGVLEIQGTTGADNVRIAMSSSNPAVVEVFNPATSATPSCSFDSTATPFATIRVLADAGDDLVVFDDSNGILSNSWAIVVDGGDDADTVLGGIDLNVVPLNSALSMISTLQQAQTLIDGVLDLLDESQSGCSTVPCLVTNAATLAKNAGNDLVRPAAAYVRDIEPELVQPSAAAVRDAHDRIANYLQIFLATNAQGLAVDAQALTTNVEVAVDQFELLLPMGQDLLLRAESLYERASRLGLETQNGDSIGTFTQTIESHVTTIREFAGLCAEDPEPIETQFDENLQDPSGLSFYCAEVERRIEALEALTDDVEGRINLIEADGDQFELDGDAMELFADGVGDDENLSSDAAQIEVEADTLVANAELLSDAANALNTDWEAWVGGVEADLEARGATMETRGQTEVAAAGGTLRGQGQTDVEAAAAVLLADAQQLAADLQALMIVAAPLLRDDLSLGGCGTGGGSCPVTPTNTLLGGAGLDVLIGTTGSDRIEGGAGIDLIVGAGGADQLLGDDGNDLIFGGGGDDEINGGADTDILVGNAGDDCIFGGGGQTLTRGSLSVELGDVFFGVDGNDTLVSGDSESDALTEIDVAFGGACNDRIRLSHGGTLTVNSFSFQFGNLAFGGTGIDDIGTGDGVDVIFGGDGDDTIGTAQGAQLTIGSGSSQFRLALGDLIFGGDGADTIDSDDSAADRADDDIDVIFGGANDDTISGYGGGLLSIGSVSNPDFELKLGNLVFGGSEDDEIATLDGIDVIFGEENDDTITTGKGALLTIGSGSNEFRLALGDLIFAGDGEDTVHADDPDGDRADDDIDVIFGGNDKDEIHGYGGGLLSIGDASDPDFELRLGNVVFGGDADDTIDTLDGIDVIFCGDGADTASAGKGHNLEIDTTFKINLGDLVFGQSGDDTLHGDAADPPDDDAEDGVDVIFGGGGNDGVYGGTGGTIELPDQNFCLLFGNLLFGGSGDDALRGDYLNWDTNDPRGGIDLIFGAGGIDTIEGAAGSLIIIGDITSGQAIVIGFGNILFGGPDNDNIYGADAAAVCSGVSDDLDDFLDTLGIADLGGAADLIFCGGGNDVAQAYDGIDFVFGGDGMDNLDGAHGGIIIVPTPLPIAFGNLMFGGEDDDVIVSLGHLALPTVPPFEIDLLFGGPCDDNISAGDGLNLVFGGRADDVITAGDGINLLFGNTGEDNITAGNAILNLVFGNRENDVINAALGINVLFGNRGSDTVVGAAGLNIAFGGKGNDVVQGGPGISILFGNSGVDQVSGSLGLCLAFGNRGNDEVDGGSGLCVLFGNAGEDDVAGGIGLCVAFGNSGHDLVGAGAGLNVLFGNGGEDRLRAGPGVSVQFGNSGNDIIEASGGLLVAFGNSSDDVLVGGGGLNLGFGNSGADQFFGGGGMNIQFGNANDDIIRGGGFADILFGNAGADQIAGLGSIDLLFGNRDADCLVSDGGNDLLFGNRGDDHVRSGSDGECDLLFGNRGNDNLYRCQTSLLCDGRFGGRGSDTKHDDCGGCSFSAPSRGEVRGVVMIDIDGDTFGDIPHAGVTVNAGSSSAVTDADGLYRIANLAVGAHALSQNVPSGYTQIAGPFTNPVTIGSMGIDLYQNQDFVNRENCFVGPDAWGCLGTACLPVPPQLECRPILVRRVMRCPDTGAICDLPTDCPCNECVPSWAVVECACVNPATDCYVSFDAAAEPTCGSQCLGNDGVLYPCQLVQDGDLFHCECSSPPPCPTELAQFTFSGVVTEVFGSRPPPWNLVNIGQAWSMTYLFARSTADQNPGDPFVGDYPAITFYQIQMGPAGSAGAVPAATTLIRNNSGVMLSPDRYDVSIPVPAAGPPATANLLLVDPSGSAWLNAGLNPHDALPLCDDILLSQFGARIFTIGSTLPGGQWQIRGSVTGFECTDCAPPAPFVGPRPKPQGLEPDATVGPNGANGWAPRPRAP